LTFFPKTSLVETVRHSVCAGLSSYRLAADQDQFRAEIMKHGPIEVDYMIYSDFLSYKSGKLMVKNDNK